MFSSTETFAMPELIPFPLEVVLQTIKAPNKMLLLNPSCISVDQSPTDPSIWTLETQSSWFGGLLKTPSRFETRAKMKDDGAEYAVEAALGVKTLAVWVCKALDGPPEGVDADSEAEGWTELVEHATVTAPYPLIGMVSGFYKESHTKQIQGLIKLLKSETGKA
jgi:hypothetical protein